MVMSEKIAEVQDIKPINVVTWKDKLEAYKKRPLSLFLLIAVTLSAGITVAVLGALIIYILANGIMNLTPELFAWKYTTENVSMLPAIINTVLMTALSLLIAVPIGICSAIYLVEYAKRGNKLVNVVRITTETLSGIPSIVYGLFGYLMFVIAFGWGLSFFGGALTLSIMVLPTIMRTTQESLKTVPQSACLIPDVHWLYTCINCFPKVFTRNRHTQPQLYCLSWSY